jgi:diguanylate cyclase (GGDEF)-like protein/PAS domain S-box-containing protein
MSTLILIITCDKALEQRCLEALSQIRGTPYRAEVVSSLTEALAWLKNNRPGSIMLDPELADSVGMASYLRLQPKAAPTPILVIVNDEELGADIVARGALDYLLRAQIGSQLLDKSLRYATERTHSMRALKASEQRYRELFQNVTAGVFQTTPEGRFISVNPALIKLLGYSDEDEVLELDVPRQVFAQPGQYRLWQETMTQAGEVHNLELFLSRKDGGRVVVLENSRAVTDDEGRVIFYEGAWTDITATHELSEKLAHDSRHDPITGLNNRRSFEARLLQALEETQASGVTHGVLFLDLDRFKPVNDRCGHLAGDALLRQVGAVLKSAVRHSDEVARFGGDEFAVLLHNCPAADAQEVAEKILRAIDRFEFKWGDQTFTLGASIGLVTVTQAFKSLTQIINAADAAMYAAKDGGRGQVVIHHHVAGPSTRIHGEAAWAARAEQALTENRFFFEVQKITPLQKSEAPCYWEVLLRLQDESGRLVPPSTFLPLMTRHGLMPRCDRWLIEAVLSALGETEHTLSQDRWLISLTGETLIDPEFLSWFKKALLKHNADPRQLGIFVHETDVLAHLPKLSPLIAELRRLGLVIVLDDFGSGVSSFAYLKALPVDYLRTDKLFVGTSRDPADTVMMRSVTEIGHAMGKGILAGNVEAEFIFNRLKQLGVDYASGPFIEAPRKFSKNSLK